MWPDLPTVRLFSNSLGTKVQPCSIATFINPGKAPPPTVPPHSPRRNRPSFENQYLGSSRLQRPRCKMVDAIPQLRAFTAQVRYDRDISVSDILVYAP